MESETREVKHVYLLCSPAYFVGESVGANLKIRHIFSKKYFSESFHAVEFGTQEPTKVMLGMVVPDYSGTGEVVAYILTILYGKLVLPVGMLITDDRYHMPEFPSLQAFDRTLPFYSDIPRAEFPVPLNRDVIGEIDGDFSVQFINASRLYHKALLEFPRSPDVAYIDLVTAGEIITSSLDVDDEDEFYGEQLGEVVRILSEAGDKGIQLSAFLKSQSKIKKKFVTGLMRVKDLGIYVDESIHSKLTPQNLRSALVGSYDLRSKYLHEGISIKRHVAWKDMEVGLTYSGNESKEVQKIFQKAAGFYALERIIRMALLQALFVSLNRELVVPTSDQPI